MKCGGCCKKGPRTRARSDAPALASITAALLALLFVACTRGQGSQGPSTSQADPVAARLSSLPVDALVSLGPHAMNATLAISDVAPKRSFESTEVYDLKWEGWRRYAYRITKEDRPTLDVVVKGDKAYQMRGDGKARPRDNVHDFHYYLQQTWNLWAVATRPFEGNLRLTPVETVTRESRPTTHYQVALRPTGMLVDDEGGTGTMRTQLLTAGGDVWVDEATGLAVEAEFNGTYKTIRVSRVPGRPDAETDHAITLNLTRTNIGKGQGIEIPTELVEAAPPPAPRAASPPGQRNKAPPKRKPR